MVLKCCPQPEILESLGSLIETQVLNPPQTSIGNPGWGPETCLVTNHSNVIKHSKDSDAHTSEKHCPKGREGTPADASNKPSGSIRTRQESLRPFSCALMNTDVFRDFPGNEVFKFFCVFFHLFVVPYIRQKCLSL